MARGYRHSHRPFIQPPADIRHKVANAMTQTINTSIRDRLISMVERTLANNSIHRPFAITDQLVDIGLTSLDMVNLLFEVEAAFDVTIPAHELTTENFETIAVIEDLMTRLDVGAHA
jgi:acyl carrier protein